MRLSIQKGCRPVAPSGALWVNTSPDNEGIITSLQPTDVETEDQRGGLIRPRSLSKGQSQKCCLDRVWWDPGLFLFYHALPSRCTPLPCFSVTLHFSLTLHLHNISCFHLILLPLFG